jgi:hypothetical protein
VSGNRSTLRTRVAAHNLQNTSKERAFFALISPRVAIAPLPDLRARFIYRRISREPIRAPTSIDIRPGVHSAVTAMRYCSPMRDDDYRRFHEACLDVAAQSTNADMRARWLAMANAWLKRVTEQQNPYRVAKHKPWAHIGHGAHAPARGRLSARFLSHPRS